MTDLEDLLRGTMRAREHDITAPAKIILPPASRRRDHRWIALPVLAGIAAAVVVAVVVIAWGDPTNTPDPVGTDPVATGPPEDELVGEVYQPPAGMQAVSSRGVEILVPSDWLINELGCGESGAPTAPTARRGRVMTGDCLGLEPSTKTIATIGSASLSWAPTGDPVKPEPVLPMTFEPVTVDGRKAERGQIVLLDGRTAGMIRFADDDVAVSVRALDPGIVTTILDSVDVVEVDNAGCRAELPDALGFLERTTDDPMAELDAVQSASLCFYMTRTGDTLLSASIVIDGPALARLIDAIGQVDFDSPPTPCPDDQPYPDAETIIALRHDDGSVRYIVMVEQDCTMQAFAATHAGAADLPHDVYSVLARTVHQGPMHRYDDR